MKVLLFLFATLFLPGSVPAQFIEIRVSVKVVVDAVNGARPAGITDQVFLDAAEAANEWRAQFWRRGYRFRVTEIVDIGGPTEGGASGPSQWFGEAVREPAHWSTFQNLVKTDPLYQGRTDQVNFYVTTPGSTDPGGACPIPPGETALIACWGLINNGPWWMNHELGHFFGLHHTFATESGTTPGDDGIADTLLDCTCWASIDDVANHHFGKPYASLSAGQKEEVDNCYYNVMSYHEAANKDTVENRMTEQQLDLFADIASRERAAFVSGLTIFLSTGGSDAVLGNPAGSSQLPYRTLGKGISVANLNGGDILLLRPGNYDERLTIEKPVTLRAPRTGWVTIGEP